MDTHNTQMRAELRPHRPSQPARYACHRAFKITILGTVLGGGGFTLEVKVTVVAGDESTPDWDPHKEWPNLCAVSPTPHEYSDGFDQ